MAFKLLVPVSLLLLCSLAFTEPLSSPWLLTRQTGNVWVWKLKGASNVIGIFQTEQRSRPIHWEKIKSKKFFLDLIHKKRKMLSLIGIKEWKVKRSNWKKQKGYRELTMEGSYYNSQNHLIDFKEVHLFYPRKTLQILLSHPRKRLVKTEVASQFIKDVKEMAFKK